MVYTRAQAEPGPTRLLPNHLGLPQTNELGQCTPTGQYRPSSHQEDCCLPHGTHTTNDRRHTPTVPSPPAASRLKSRKSFMRTVTPLDSSASSSRLRLWEHNLTDVPASFKMGLVVAEALPAGSGEDWLLDEACRADDLATVTERAKTCARRWEKMIWSTWHKEKLIYFIQGRNISRAYIARTEFDVAEWVRVWDTLTMFEAIQCAVGHELDPRPGQYSRMSFSSDQVTDTVFPHLNMPFLPNSEFI